MSDISGVWLVLEQHWVRTSPVHDYYIAHLTTYRYMHMYINME